MSFDEYVHHISQKYRLAVAISVIKTKPENVSIEEFLLQLQNKIVNEGIDPNETVCSDDFNFDDDDIEKQCNTENGCTISENVFNCSVNGIISQNSQTILNDFQFDDGCCPQKENSLGDTIRLLKELATNVQEQPYNNQNYSQTTFCESQEVDTHCYKVSNATIESNKQPQNVTNKNTDSQETQLYTLHSFTQDYSHVSQTQNEYFVMPDKYLRSSACNPQNLQNYDMLRYDVIRDVTNEGKEKENTVIQYKEHEIVNVTNSLINTTTEMISKADAVSKVIIANVAKNIGKETDYENKQTTIFQIENRNESGTSRTPDNNNEAYIIKENNIRSEQYSTSNVEDTYVTNTQNSPKNQNTVNKFTRDIDKTHNFGRNAQSNSVTDKNTTQNENIENVEQEIDENIEEEMDVDTESDEIVEERVPFKVIEELNRVKTFLNRREKKYDGYSTDSGYRSESQHRGSLRSCSQPSSENWLNQSAYCLFNFILQALPTDDIVKEIAQVLGKLIDKLQEDENYPQFLEELLETVDGMIREIHTGDGWADNLILTKEEKIQRLILLNKSKHILKYSIEQITAILQNTHTNLLQENLYEFTNIVNLENICYIFNVLEVFIKRYKKVKDVTSQSQNSQEDVLPKRSSLTELWRKKWNPNCKEIVKKENKICVLKSCSVILNKIIVECMSGYSLVSFSALQCFNLIQD